MIKKLTKQEIINALPMVCKVFNEYEAVNYPASGTQAFWDAIHDEGFLSQLSAYGAFGGETLIGILASRNEDSHIALFFVDGAYHRQGIGRRLWNAFLADSDKDEITVNSSLYADGIYEKLGFTKTAEPQEESGIRFVPMIYRKRKNHAKRNQSGGKLKSDGVRVMDESAEPDGDVFQNA